MDLLRHFEDRHPLIKEALGIFNEQNGMEETTQLAGGFHHLAHALTEILPDSAPLANILDHLGTALTITMDAISAKWGHGEAEPLPRVDAPAVTVPAQPTAADIDAVDTAAQPA